METSKLTQGTLDAASDLIAEARTAVFSAQRKLSPFIVSQSEEDLLHHGQMADLYVAANELHNQLFAAFGKSTKAREE